MEKKSIIKNRLSELRGLLALFSLIHTKHLSMSKHFVCKARIKKGLSAVSRLFEVKTFNFKNENKIKFFFYFNLFANRC